MTHKHQKLIDDGVIVAVDDNTVRLTPSAWDMMNATTSHLPKPPPAPRKGHAIYSKKDDCDD